MTDASRLADSLRAMAQQTKNHRDAWRPNHYKEPLTFVRAGDLTDAAYLIERQAAEIQSLREAAHGLSTLAGELAADLDRANGGADDPHLSARFEVTR